MNPGASEWQEILATYKTPSILLIQSIGVRHHYTQTNTNNINKNMSQSSIVILDLKLT